MSWRTGSKLFIEIWPLIQANIIDKEERIEFTGELLQIFTRQDMDTWDVEDVHPDIRAAMRHVGIEIAEPDRYKDEDKV
jgi:hypothetical protein